MDNIALPEIIKLSVILGLVGLAPFIAVMATSFVKISIVLSLVRNAIGVQQVPPNIALYGLSLILTFYIMAPVGYETLTHLQDQDFQIQDIEKFKGTADKVLAPYKRFLGKHVGDTQKEFFLDHAKEQWPEAYRDEATGNSILILVPAFAITELTKAFEIGFLIYLPFLAIDLIISNILLALGMMMVSPMTVSLPFKLLLFVMLDGWARLIHGLVLSY